MKNQIRRISESPWLRLVGACLAATLLVTSYYWWDDQMLTVFSRDFGVPTCHAFFPTCADWTFETATAESFLALLALFATLSILGFSGARTTGLGVAFLIAGSLLKFAIFVGRFNIMGNYHLVPFLLTFAYLAFNPARSSYRLQIVLVYFLAGLLKLGPEWMSGAALITSPFLEGKWLALALAYAPVLELIVVWGLLARAKWIRVLTLLQLAAFHVFSWHVVGSFYPIIMFCVLLPIAAELFPKFEDPDSFRRYSRAAVAFSLLLIAFHLWPWVSGFDPSLEGKFRGLRLNMLDARVECRPVAFIEEAGRNTFLNLFYTRALRTKCDPVTYETQLRRVCPELDDSRRLHFLFYAKRETDTEFKRLRATDDFCKQGFFDVQNF